MILLYTTTVFPFLKKNCFNLKCLSASCGYILWWQMGLLHLTTHPQQDLLKRFWQSHCLFKKITRRTTGARGCKFELFQSIFNERKLVLGPAHVKVKVKVKVKVHIKKLRNIGVLPWSLDDLRYCLEHLDIEQYWPILSNIIEECPILSYIA